MTTQTTDQDKRELEALRFSSRAARAITTLEVQQRESIGQLSLDGMDAIEITPELEALVHDPVRGLM
jgi:hypothetical protein